MAEQTKVAAGKTETKQVRKRSPAYPAMSLAEAIEKARTLYKASGFHWTNKDVAIAGWDYGVKSSPGIRALAALLHFGLLEEKGSGAARQVRLSELGKTLVLDEREGSTERTLALRKAALNPPIFAKLWERWKPSLPSDQNIRYVLERELEFNPLAVPGFIKDFRATVDFAKLAESDNLSESEADRGGEDAGLPPVQDRPRQEKPMPQTQSGQSQVWDFPIPLIGGGQAILRTPIPLSEENYSLLTSMLENTLKSMKKAITKQTEGNGTAEPGS